MGASRVTVMMVAAALVTAALLVVSQWNASGTNTQRASQEALESDPVGRATNTPLPSPVVQELPPSDLDVARSEAWSFYDAVIAPKVDVQEVHVRKMSQVEWLGVVNHGQYPLTEDLHYYVYAIASRDDVQYSQFMGKFVDPVDPITGESLDADVTPDTELDWFYLCVPTHSAYVSEFGGLNADADMAPPNLPTLKATGIALERPER